MGRLREVMAALLVTMLSSCGVTANQPHIVFILADDLGYNDVSWHNPDILSPTLGQLASEGVILERNYAQPLCTPSRSALLSGRYPFHIGRQSDVLSPRMPTGLTINSTLLPARLRSAGYSTHMIGKWHLGHCAAEYLPQGRGFDSFLGYWAGEEDHYTHLVQDALDYWDGETPLPELDGEYSADVFTERAERIIRGHNASQPLFLYLAFQNVHLPLQVPTEYEDLYPSAMNADRRTYSGMVSSLDDSVASVVTALKDADLYNNSVIIFVSDNGGHIHDRKTGGREGCGASNYPLRGDKNTLWEGGTRTPAFVHSPLLERSGYVNHEMIHITDWLPTLVHLGGASSGGDDDPLDGFNQWDTISAGEPSARNEIVYNIDETMPNAALRIGDMKLLWGNNSVHSDWYPVLETSADLENPAHGSKPKSTPSKSSTSKSFKAHKVLDFSEYPAYLYNVTADPTEREDLSSQMPETVLAMQERLLELLEELVPADLPDPDPRGDPVDGVWTTGWCEPY